MVCHWVYLCLAPSCSILPERRPCVDHHCIPPHWGRADSSAEAGSSVLTFEKPNSTQQWNLRPAGGGKAAVWWRNKKIYRGGGNMWKKEEKQKGEKKKVKEVLHGTLQGEGDEFQSCDLLQLLFFPPAVWLEQLRVVSAELWLQSTVRKNLFPIWGSCVHRKRLSTPLSYCSTLCRSQSSSSRTKRKISKMTFENRTSPKRKMSNGKLGFGFNDVLSKRLPHD